MTRIPRTTPDRSFRPIIPGHYHSRSYITSTEDTFLNYDDYTPRIRPVFISHDFKPQRTIEINNAQSRQKIKHQIYKALVKEKVKDDALIAISEVHGGTNSSLIYSGIKDPTKPAETLHSLQFKLKGDHPEHDISIARDIIGQVGRQAKNCGDLFGELCVASWHKGGKADIANDDASDWKHKPGYWAHVNRAIVDRAKDYGKNEPYSFGEATQSRFDDHSLNLHSSVTNGPDGTHHLSAKNKQGIARRYHSNIQNDGSYGLQSFRDLYGIPKEETIATLIYGSGYNTNIGQGNMIVNTENGHITRKTCPALQQDWDQYGQFLELQRVGSSQEFGNLERHELIVAGGNTDNQYAGPKLAANNIINSITEDLARDGQASAVTSQMLKLLGISFEDAKVSDLIDIKRERNIDNPDIDRSILTNYNDGTVSQKGLLALKIYENLAHRAGTILAKFFDDSQVKKEQELTIDFRKATKIGIIGSQGKGMYDRKMPPSILGNFVNALNQVRPNNPLYANDVIIHAPIQDGAYAAALARLGIQMRSSDIQVSSNIDSETEVANTIRGGGFRGVKHLAQTS